MRNRLFDQANHHRSSCTLDLTAMQQGQVRLLAPKYYRKNL
jgi:hypothetical protein